MIRKILGIIKKDSKKNKKLQFVKIEHPIIEFVPARLIEGIYDRHSIYFWKHHGYTKENYMTLAKKSVILYEKYLAGESIERLKKNFECQDIIYAYLDESQVIKVYKREGKYLLVTDGRHRVVAAQELDTYIPVKITGEYR